MSHRVRSFLMLAVILLGTFAGCGNTGGDEEEPDEGSGDSGAVETVDADIASGCWTASQRVRDGEGASDSVATHQQWSQAPAMVIDPAKRYTATLETSKGTVEVEFYPEDAPKTVNNFVCLARAGYFDGTPFHRILAGFVIQGGDPTGTGSGGPGYRFEDEPISREYEKGTLAMANAGPNTNGSQFFVVLDDLRGRLQKNYTIFGKVTAGLDIVDQIAQTPVTVGGSGERSSPTEPVTLQKVTIAEA